MMSLTILASVHLAIALAAQAQVPAGGRATAEEAAGRLKFMKDSLQPYHLILGGDRSTALKLQEEPVFRMGKQGADNVEEGAIFLWTGEFGRPEAAIQVFQIKDSYYPQGLWIHEFTSLSPVTLTATRNAATRWSPRAPGVVFQTVPGAPRPARSVAQRARQMRELAAGFHASDDFKAKGWTELRLLPTPILRYGESGTTLLDGALFSFVTGTDPEVFLFLEARPGQGRDGPEWQYALAPMTCYAGRGSYRGKAVWELPNRDPARDPFKPFFSKEYLP
jgi:hypothetical protein